MIAKADKTLSENELTTKAAHTTDIDDYCEIMKQIEATECQT